MTLLHAQRAPDAGDKNKFSPIKPMVEVKRSSLYDNSHIIVHQGAHTIVPKKKHPCSTAYIERANLRQT